ncbi:MAG: hypothetical protein IPK67_10445 [Planctomycetes bacterium]|jgi:hypothetical protein|nr:hypothetical protein [Planctomycetota bacterium]
MKILILACLAVLSNPWSYGAPDPMGALARPDGCSKPCPDDVVHAGVGPWAITVLSHGPGNAYPTCEPCAAHPCEAGVLYQFMGGPTENWAWEFGEEFGGGTGGTAAFGKRIKTLCDAPPVILWLYSGPELGTVQAIYVNCPCQN